MSAAFWVSLSTLIFLGIVVYNAYSKVINYFLKQQEEIKNKIFEANDINQKALNLYQEYTQKLELLESESQKILNNAHNQAKMILDSAEQHVSHLVLKSNLELSKRVDDYEEKIRHRVLLHYADSVANHLYEKAS